MKRKEIKFVGVNTIWTTEALLFCGSTTWTIYHLNDDRNLGVQYLGLNCQNCQWVEMDDSSFLDDLNKEGLTPPQ